MKNPGIGIEPIPGHFMPVLPYTDSQLETLIRRMEVFTMRIIGVGIVLFYFQNSTIDGAEGNVVLIKEFNQEIVLENAGKQPVNQAIYHTGRNAIYDHRPCNGEHLRTDAQDKALCCCQVRPH